MEKKFWRQLTLSDARWLRHFFAGGLGGSDDRLLLPLLTMRASGRPNPPRLLTTSAGVTGVTVTGGVYAGLAPLVPLVIPAGRTTVNGGVRLLGMATTTGVTVRLLVVDGTMAALKAAGDPPPVTGVTVTPPEAVVIPVTAAAAVATLNVVVGVAPILLAGVAGLATFSFDLSLL